MTLPRVKDYPKSVRVNGETYPIRFVKVVNRSKDTCGLCSPEPRMIYIKKGMTEVETFSTLLHELLHAIEFEYDLSIKHSLIYKLEQAMTDVYLNLSS